MIHSDCIPSHCSQVVVLGSTGSIGLNTLDVISQHPDRFSVFALTANTSIELLAQQCLKFLPRYVVVGNGFSAMALQQILNDNHCKTDVLHGIQSLQDVAEHADVDIVVAAIVGAAGLLPTMAAVQTGKRVLLANKESLVMAGRLFMDAVIRSKAQLIPIDSEHNAIFQCLSEQFVDGESGTQVRKILLTGSGGPFRTWSVKDIRRANPEEACNHPNWSMGRKISVDSASLMNKGLEFIEAKWLFDVEPSKIDVVIHPQSIIHSMVEYIDGSVIAQLGNPDMRIPIAYGLTYPDRITAGVPSLDVIAVGQLNFEAPDMMRFPGLRLAMEAADAGTGAAATLNAANEVAVEAFLAQRISFGQVTDILQQIMNTAHWDEPMDLESVVNLDGIVRSMTREAISALD
ncbi:1-deoxy-D-xylulose-5-phosphate reductoisomerase [Candidatus Endobugula sertula]|uniref:1-deoxy-D-xylulose 5-phosphate reductoisomerase n=1 Tax=Candidatus Endobugula sertula TaxID=62101 RepID=A0A1D2QQT3_9GAMM|nr:1-deoxy-D-xylulose-5-phosphate reductoisomerase [Candidatus Endobugula sertula]